MKKTATLMAKDVLVDALVMLIVLCPLMAVMLVMVEVSPEFDRPFLVIFNLAWVLVFGCFFMGVAWEKVITALSEYRRRREGEGYGKD